MLTDQTSTAVETFQRSISLPVCANSNTLEHSCVRYCVGQTVQIAQITITRSQGSRRIVAKPC